MKQCKCGSWAINHHLHGRDGTDDDLCDVCYWRKRAALAEPESINNAAVKLLMRAEVEMRYAGWAAYISDNPSRSYVYHDIAAFLTAYANGNKAEPKAEQEPVAWRWLYDGKPFCRSWSHGGGQCYPLPVPDADIITRAAAAEIPRTVQYLWDGPPPPHREWVGLTDEAIADIVYDMNGNEPTAPFWRDLACAIERALREKNT